MTKIDSGSGRERVVRGEGPDGVAISKRGRGREFTRCPNCSFKHDIYLKDCPYCGEKNVDR